MNRRILSAIIALLGVVAIVLAVCSATIWRPSSTAHADLAQTPTQNYVVTEPGVLGVVDSDVTITATAASSDQPVVIAIGHSADVKAWLATDPYVSVTGLSSWTALASTDVTSACPTASATPSASTTASASAAASAAASTAASASATATASTDDNGCTALTATGANPSSSDLWLTSATGTGKATLEIDATDSDLVALIATDGSTAAPQVSLSWPRSVSTPWLIPGLVIGGLLLLIGIFLFLLDIQLRHADEQRRARAAERAARIARADSVATVGIPRIDDPDRPLTRREKRDKERAESLGEEWIDPRTGRVYLDGVEAPTVPQAPASTGVETLTDAEAESAVGAARGSAVVPGLDEESATAHRSARELEDDSALVIAPQGEDDGTAGPEQSPESPADPETADGAQDEAEGAADEGHEAVDGAEDADSAEEPTTEDALDDERDQADQDHQDEEHA